MGRVPRTEHPLGSRKPVYLKDSELVYDGRDGQGKDSWIDLHQEVAPRGL